MKFVSELTNKQYDSIEDCLAAEKEYKAEQAKIQEAAAKAQKVREADIKKLDELYRKYTSARTEYFYNLKVYQKKYGNPAELTLVDVIDLLNS